MAAVTLTRRSVAVPPVSPGLVEELWVARSPHGAPPRVALPDGRPCAVARLGGPARWVDPLTRESEVVAGMLRGPRTVPRVVLPADPAEPSWEVGARLAPWALSALHPAGTLVDDHRPLGEALGLDEEGLTDRLRACWAGAGEDEAAVAAARVLEQAISAAVRRPLPVTDREDLQRIARYADEERGLVRSVDLARSVDRSLASLHALLHAHVGLTPSAFLATVRLSCAVRELGVDDRGDAARVVAVLRGYCEAGYPQREVERFTGLSALELRRAVRGMEDLLATA
ncbi:helix-turn-helix domain-containing protein [Cellulomonas sp. Marseille-Q8402]